MKRLFGIFARSTFFVVLLGVCLGLLLGGAVFDSSGLVPEADAALAKSKRVGFMGWQYENDLGNTTGNSTNVKVGLPEIPDEFNCLFSVTNSTGAIVANTATVQIRTSYDNLLFDIVQTVSLSASTVTGARNVPVATTPFGNYWDMNITAIQNANGSRVNAQCVFE